MLVGAVCGLVCGLGVGAVLRVGALLLMHALALPIAAIAMAVAHASLPCCVATLVAASVCSQAGFLSGALGMTILAGQRRRQRALRAG